MRGFYHVPIFGTKGIGLVGVAQFPTLAMGALLVYVMVMGVVM
jgi:hypothetical protein